MPVYLPIAEITLAVEHVLLLGVIVGFLAGVFGVGGGFLTTPFLIFMGVPPAVAVGTQSCQLVASSVAGSLGHWRKGNVDIRMGSVMLGGGLLGSCVGIGIFGFLQYFGQIDFVLALLYVIFLGSIGLMMLWESLWSLKPKKIASLPEKTTEKPYCGYSALLSRLPWKIRFVRSRLYISVLVPISIGFLGGMLVSIMGIGGGFILVPAMIYILEMPILLVVGTSLFQIVFTASLSTLLHATTNHTVDAVLAGLLIIGGLIGTRMGVWAARFIAGTLARVLLALLVIGVATTMGHDMFIGPLEPFSIVVREG